MRDFLIEISVKEDGKAVNKKIIVLNADETEIDIYQKQNGEMVRIFEIECSVDQDGAITVAEFVGEDYHGGINMQISSENKVMKIRSKCP